MKREDWISMLKTAGIMLFITVAALFLNRVGIGKENMLMMYIVGVLLVASCTYGYFLTILFSVTGVMVFNYFFTAPQYTLKIIRKEDVILLAFFIVTALLTSKLAVRFQKQVQVANEKERTSRLLYEMSESLFQVTGTEEIVKRGLEYIEKDTGCKGKVYLFSNKEEQYREECEGFPVTGVSRVLGILKIDGEAGSLTEAQELLIKMAANQIGIALDREMIYLEQEKIKLEMEREHMRSSMLRSISHDLRTPLTGIAGASNLILQSESKMDKESLYSLIKDINEQAEWLIRFTENILNMTKIESGNLLIEKHPEVVDDVVNDAVSHLMGLHSTRKFHLKLPEELFFINVDARLMVQVLLNLLDNAMKHTEEMGEISLIIKKEKDRCLFIVEDDGDGIAKENLPMLFEEFASYEDRISDSHKGIGLGLAICKAIVKEHGGDIWAENREKGGARFVFYIPIDEEMEDSYGKQQENSDY